MQYYKAASLIYKYLYHIKILLDKNLRMTIKEIIVTKYYQVALKACIEILMHSIFFYKFHLIIRLLGLKYILKLGSLPFSKSTPINDINVPLSSKESFSIRILYIFWNF